MKGSLRGRGGGRQGKHGARNKGEGAPRRNLAEELQLGKNLPPGPEFSRGAQMRMYSLYRRTLGEQAGDGARADPQSWQRRPPPPNAYRPIIVRLATAPVALRRAQKGSLTQGTRVRPTERGLGPVQPSAASDEGGAHSDGSSGRGFGAQWGDRYVFAARRLGGRALAVRIGVGECQHLAPQPLVGIAGEHLARAPGPLPHTRARAHARTNTHTSGAAHSTLGSGLACTPARPCRSGGRVRIAQGWP